MDIFSELDCDRCVTGIFVCKTYQTVPLNTNREWTGIRLDIYRSMV